MAKTLSDYLAATKTTQTVFAKRIGVRDATVSSWVNGAIPKSKYIGAIADATNGEVPASVWFMKPPQSGNAA